MRSSLQVGTEIKQIADLVIGPKDGGRTLICSIEGTASGIPGAFMDHLDQIDQSGRSSELLHELLVEYAGSIAAEMHVQTPKNVILTFKSGEMSIATE